MSYANIQVRKELGLDKGLLEICQDLHMLVAVWNVVCYISKKRVPERRCKYSALEYHVRHKHAF